MEGQQRVGALIEVPQVLRDLGAEPGPVIARAGIDPAVLRNPENSLSFFQFGSLLHACTMATDCQYFGLLLGQKSGTPSLGLVGRLMRSAPTLKDAILDLCSNQQRYVRGSVAYLMIQGETAFWGYAVHLPGVQAIEQIGDAAAAVGFNMMRELVATPPDDVLLSRYAPGNAVPYRRAFALTPKFDAEQNALVFPAHLLARPVRTADPELRKILQKSVSSYWAVREPGTADRVIRTLRGRIMFPDTSAEGVAASLSLHPRTLNRRLQIEGTSFRNLLNQARFETARQLLAGTKMEITDISLALGYADASAMTHAFRRWSGTAPKQWRELLSTGPGASCWPDHCDHGS